jgi:hypothetical protein
MDGSFWPLHAAANGAILTAELLVASLALYLILEFIEKRLALFIAGLPWLYHAYLHLMAATANLQLRLYVKLDPTLADLRRMLLG